VRGTSGFVVSAKMPACLACFVLDHVGHAADDAEGMPVFDSAPSHSA